MMGIRKSCRELAAAWIVGGGIWLTGLGGLAAVSLITGEEAMQTAENGISSYFLPTQTWSTYQDPSGKYSVVERSLRRVLAD